MTWEELQPGLTEGKVATLDDKQLVFKMIPSSVKGSAIDFMKSVPQQMKDAIHRNCNIIKYVEQYIVWDKETGLATNYFPNEFALQTHDWKFVIS